MYMISFQVRGVKTIIELQSTFDTKNISSMSKLFIL